MRKIAYFDCFSGLSGDMILGALVDAGLPLDELRAALRCLPLEGYSLEARRVRRGGLSGTRVFIRLERGAGRRISGLKDIVSVIEESTLPPEVVGKAGGVFRELAGAEAKVHGAALPDVHLHEVGAVDSIIDVVGAVAGLHLLDIEKVYASALPWSSGTVKCAHGTLPVPAPAAAELMKGMPVRAHPAGKELVTPTGAAIIRVCADAMDIAPSMKVERIGYGAGRDRIRGFPNLLRVVVGEEAGDGGEERIFVIETEVDDMTPALCSHLCERLLAEGAHDVFTTAVAMKKGRVGHLITVLSPPERLRAVSETIFEESSTLGVRFREERRVTVPRTEMEVSTPYGRARVKLARRPGGRITVSPEHEDCARLARRAEVPIAGVMSAAARAAEVRVGQEGASLFEKAGRGRTRRRRGQRS